MNMHPEKIQSAHSTDTKEEIITVVREACVVDMRHFGLLVYQHLEIAYVSNTTLG